MEVSDDTHIVLVIIAHLFLHLSFAKGGRLYFRKGLYFIHFVVKLHSEIFLEIVEGAVVSQRPRPSLNITIHISWTDYQVTKSE